MLGCCGAGVGCHTGGRGGDVFDFFETFGPVVDSELPYTHITNQTDDANGKYVLEAIHASLMAYHRDALTAAGMWERVSASRPVDGYLSLWDHKTAGFGAGTHGEHDHLHISVHISSRWASLLTPTCRRHEGRRDLGVGRPEDGDAALWQCH